jgi:hypothetical protein
MWRLPANLTMHVSTAARNESPSRFGSFADVALCPRHVRFAPNSGHASMRRERPLCARSRLHRAPASSQRALACSWSATWANASVRARPSPQPLWPNSGAVLDVQRIAATSDAPAATEEEDDARPPEDLLAIDVPVVKGQPVAHKRARLMRLSLMPCGSAASEGAY